MIVTSDHSQAAVEERIRLDRAFAEFDVATPERVALGRRRARAQPGAALGDGLRARPRAPRRAGARARVEAVGGLDGRRPRDLWLAEATGEAVVRSRRGELRFAAGGELVDAARGAVERRGRARGAARARSQDGRFLSTDYPDALARIWSALHCPTAGDVLLSAAPGLRVRRLGRRRPRRRRQPRLAAPHRLARGAAVVRHRTRLARRAREQWSLRDIAPMIRDHFGRPRAGTTIVVGPDGVGLEPVLSQALTLAPISADTFPAVSEELTTTLDCPRSARAVEHGAVAHAPARPARRPPSGTTGCSCSGSARVGATGYVVNLACSRSACTCSGSTTGSRR